MCTLEGECLVIGHCYQYWQMLADCSSVHAATVVYKNSYGDCLFFVCTFVLF